MKAPSHPSESSRLGALRQYSLLDTAPEPEFDDLTHLAALICETPISTISLIDEDRQWFKARVGVEVCETPRDISICAYAILEKELLLVPDTTQDARFAANPLIIDGKQIRFYAGVPLITPENHAVGTLCVMDTVPRILSQKQQDALHRLARQVMVLLEARPAVPSTLRASRHTRHEAERRQRILAAEATQRNLDEQQRVITEQERFFTLSLDMLCVVDATGCLLRVNPSFGQVLGFTPEELIGRSAFDFVHPDDRAPSETVMGQLVDGIPVINFVNRFRCRDGSYRSVLWVTAPYGDQFYAAGRDITGRVEADEAIQESQRFLNSTLDALASHIAVLDEDGSIIAVNKAWREFAEANGGSVVGCGVGANYIKVCETSRGRWSREAVEVAQGIRSVMAGEQPVFALEYPCHSAVEERWFNVTVTRFFGEGAVRVVVAHENITARKEVEKTLWQSERQFRAVFDNALEAIVVTDDLGCFLEVNPAACRIYGANRERLLSMRFSDFTEPEWDFDEANRSFKEAGQESGEFLLVLPDGSKKYVEYAAVANFLPGRHLMAARDITERKRAENSVRASEERLRLVTDNARVGLVMLDRERRYTFANATYAEILGLPSSDIIGLRVADVLAPLYDQIAPRLDSAFAGERVSYELRRSTPEGDRHYVVRYEPTKVGGAVPLVVVVITDITERKQAEEAMRESEMRMAGIVNAAMDAIITIDSSQRIILFNPAAERMFGHVGANVLGQPIECLMPQRYRAAHGEHIRVFGNTGMTSRKMGALGAISGVRANGEEFPIEASISQIEIAGQALFTVILRDITEHKQAEAALQRAHAELEARVAERTAEIQWANELLRVEVIEKKLALDTLQEVAEAFRSTQDMLQLVMNHIPQAIFWKDKNSIFLGCNNRLAQDAGFRSPGDVSGKSDFDMSWADYAADYQTDDALVMASDTAKLNIEEPSVQANGNTVWLRTNKIPLHNREGKVVGVLCSYEDITEQKQAETALHDAKREADAANRAKSEFLSRMSHELRTPLNAILGFGQILQQQDLTPLSQESLGYILKGGQHLLDLINEVLDIARVEAGRIELSLESIALDDIVPEACALMRSLAAEHNIRLNERPVSGGRLFVMADRQRLKQVLINLLANAIKYNREGGLVEVNYEPQEDGRIGISIRDTGPGISPEDLPKLFTPFERLNASSTDVEGTGLGLALSQRLTAAMEGSLSVSSSLGQGSTFTINLPQTSSPEGEIANSITDIRSPNQNQSPECTYKVLCIEDNPSNLRLLEVIFQDRPEISLLTAIQGSVGLDLARQHEPDLILLDLNLPDMHGRDVMARLRQSAVTREIPVVVISADATPAQIQRLMETGAMAYLTKPINVNQVLEVLDNFLYPPATDSN